MLGSFNQVRALLATVFFFVALIELSEHLHVYKYMPDYSAIESDNQIRADEWYSFKDGLGDTEDIEDRTSTGNGEDSSLRKDLSDLLGIISTVLWMSVGFPQFYENFKNKSAEGLSWSFLGIWYAGDALFLVGCYMSDQLISEKLVGWWYTLMDTILIGQVIYYDVIHKGRLKKNSNPDDEEDSEFNKRDNRKHSTSGSELADYSATADYDEEPLLTQKIANSFGSPLRDIHNKRRSSGTFGVASSFNSSLHYGAQSTAINSLSLSDDTVDFPSSAPSRTGNEWSPKMLYMVPLLCVFMFASRQCLEYASSPAAYPHSVSVTGTSGNLYTGRTLLQFEDSSPSPLSYPSPSPSPSPSPIVVLGSSLCETSQCTNSEEICLFGEVSAWLGAFLFLASRMPQIIKNFKRKSTEGLSLLMFFFAVMGNLTLALSILIVCLEPTYLIQKAPYLVGSLGTLCFDLVIFCQFYYYKKNTDITLEEDLMGVKSDAYKDMEYGRESKRSLISSSDESETFNF